MGGGVVNLGNLAEISLERTQMMAHTHDLYNDVSNQRDATTFSFISLF